MTVCAAPRHDGDQAETEAHSYLCRPCRTGLGRDLRRLPALDHELGILSVIASAAAQVETGVLRLPFSADIAEWQAWFRRNVTTTVRDILEEHPNWPPPRDHPWAMCVWLGPQVSRSSLHPGWISRQDWAPFLADAMHKIRVRGEQLHEPLTVKHVFLPGACLDCGNGRLTAVIYVDAPGGRRAWWACPACETATEMGPAWWDYPKRLAAQQANLQPVVER